MNQLIEDDFFYEHEEFYTPPLTTKERMKNATEYRLKKCNQKADKVSTGFCLFLFALFIGLFFYWMIK